VTIDWGTTSQHILNDALKPWPFHENKLDGGSQYARMVSL